MMGDKFCNFWREKNGLEYMEQTVDVVYLAFSKAFDTVCHHILIEKLMKKNYVDRKAGWKIGWASGLKGLWSAAQCPAGAQSLTKDLKGWYYIQ